MASYQGLYAKFVSMMSLKCSIVENDGGASHTLSATAAIFSGVSTVFGFSRFALCQFLSLFSQDNEHMELTVLLIYAYILQHYLDFQTNVAIFPSVVQAYTHNTFGGRIKLIICQIRHELSFIIYEISLS